MLRIAHPDSALSIPSLLVHSYYNSSYKTDSGFFVPSELSLLESHGVRPHLTITRNGGDAIAMLRDGLADLAIATHAKDGLTIGKGEHLRLVADLGWTTLAGLTTTKNLDRSTLPKMPCLTPKGSLVGQEFQEYMQIIGYSIAAPQGETPEDVARDIARTPSREFLLIGWPSWLNECRDRLHQGRTDRDLYPLPPELLPRVSPGLYVNIKTINPGALRAYLLCLRQVINEQEAYLKRAYNNVLVRERIFDEYFPGTDVESLKLSIKAVRLPPYLDLILQLWNREFTDSRLVNQFS
jgi:hypothetical protein